MYQVMLVDDEAMVLEGLQKIIDWKSYGFNICSVADDGISCLKMLEEVNPDLIITDIKMRQMDGLEMLCEIRKLDIVQPKVVFLTGYNEFEYAKQALDYQARNYILKPILEEELLAILIQIKEELDSNKKINQVLISYEKNNLQTTLSDLSQNKVSEDKKKSLDTILNLSQDFQYIAGIIHIGILQEIPDEVFAGIYADVSRKLDDLIMSESHNKDTRCLSFNIDKLNLGLFIAYNKEIFIQEYLQRLSFWLKNDLIESNKFSIVMSYGNTVNSLNDFDESYRNAKYAIRFSVYYDNRTLICYDEIKEVKLNKISYNNLIPERNLIQAIVTSQYEDIYAFFSSNFMKIKLEKVLYEEIIIYVNKIYFNIMQELDKNNVEDVYENKAYLLSLNERIPPINVLMKEILNFAIWSSDKIQNQSKKSNATSEIVDYIQKHYKENITLKSIAEHFYLNPVYLGQIFQKNLQIGFKKYLENIRLEESKKLLKTTNKPVYEVAYAVGYNDPEYYSRVFQKAYGLTPSQYKNQ
jgi:two-component system response regulator YesN